MKTLPILLVLAGIYLPTQAAPSKSGDVLQLPIRRQVRHWAPSMLQKRRVPRQAAPLSPKFNDSGPFGDDDVVFPDEILTLDIELGNPRMCRLLSKGIRLHQRTCMCMGTVSAKKYNATIDYTISWAYFFSQGVTDWNSICILYTGGDPRWRRWYEPK